MNLFQVSNWFRITNGAVGSRRVVVPNILFSRACSLIIMFCHVNLCNFHDHIRLIYLIEFPPTSDDWLAMKHRFYISISHLRELGESRLKLIFSSSSQNQHENMHAWNNNIWACKLMTSQPFINLYLISRRQFSRIFLEYYSKCCMCKSSYSMRIFLLCIFCSIANATKTTAKPNNWCKFMDVT